MKHCCYNYSAKMGLGSVVKVLTSNPNFSSFSSLDLRELAFHSPRMAI